MSAQHFSGVGDPNGVVYGNPGDIYQDETPGSSTFWTKAFGVGTSTGWVALSSASQYVFVYQPGGVAIDNVYTDWALLYAALSAVKGERLVEFDESFTSPCVIPAGVYALEDVIFTGNWTRPNTDVTFDVGVITTGLRHIRTSLRISASDPTTAPIADFTQASNTLLLDDGVWFLPNSPIVDFSGLGNEDQGYLIVRNGSRVLGSVPQPITNGACTLSVTIDGPNSQCGDLTINPGTGTVIVRVTGGPGMVFTAPVNGGQFLVAGAMGQLPGTFVAGDFFGATSPDGIVFIVDTSGGPVTCLNMRAAAQCPGSFVAFKKSNDLNPLTILTGSADTIDGLASYVVSIPKGEVTLVSNGVDNWMVMGEIAGPRLWSYDVPGATPLGAPTEIVSVPGFTTAVGRRYTMRANASVFGQKTPPVPSFADEFTILILRDPNTKGETELARAMATFVAEADGDIFGSIMTACTFVGDGTTHEYAVRLFWDTGSGTNWITVPTAGAAANYTIQEDANQQ